MAKTNVQDAVAKWSRNTTASIPSIKQGVMGTKQSPGVKAAAAGPRMAAKVQESVDSGRFQDGCLSYTLADWQRATIEKGTPRIAAGVKEAESKQAAFFTQLLPVSAAISDECSAMPKDTVEDSIARAAHCIRRMKEFRFQKRRA